MKFSTSFFKDWRILVGFLVTAPICLWILLSSLDWFQKITTLNLIIFSFTMMILHKDKGIRHAAGWLKVFSLIWLVVSMVLWTILLFKML